MTRVYLRGSARSAKGAQDTESTVVSLRFADSPVRAQGGARWLLALWLVLTLGFVVAEPAVASGRKAAKFYKQGRTAELGKDYDKALEFYEQAVAEDPEDPKHLLAASRMRFVAGQTHVEIGRRQREQGHLEEAAACSTSPAATPRRWRTPWRSRR